MKKILIFLSILAVLIILANVYLYFKYPFSIKLIPISQIIR